MINPPAKYFLTLILIVLLGLITVTSSDANTKNSIKIKATIQANKLNNYMVVNTRIHSNNYVIRKIKFTINNKQVANLGFNNLARKNKKPLFKKVKIRTSNFVDGNYNLKITVITKNGLRKTVTKSITITNNKITPPTSPEDQVLNPSGVEMPTGNLPGWRQIFADDFTINAALGTMGSDSDASKIVYTGSTGAKWVTYPKTYKDTYQKRPYRSDAVLSVNNGSLDFWLHNVDGMPAGANPSPVITGSSQYQTYGRYSARVKVDAVDLSEYYMAWLLWPQNESHWESAESDYPEGNLASGVKGVHGFHHYGPGGQQEVFGDNTVDMHQWHTYTQEWTPIQRHYYVDGRLIHTSTNPVYNGPERWQLQTETNGNGTNPGHLLVDWVAVYAYAP